MNIRTFESEQALAEASARVLADALREKPDALMCFAAGMTQASTYRVFADMAQSGLVDVSRARVVGLDEMVGVRRANREGFHHFLDVKLFGPAGIRDEQVVFFDATDDPAAQCARVNEYLDREGPIDFLLLGIGMNGHIGYNEPGSSPEGRCHAVELEGSSVAVASAYFDHAVKAEQGITLGLKDLFAARRTLVQAVGTGKADIVAKVIQGPVSPEIPASLLRERQGITWFLDAAASSKLAV